jgi:hypothetical protein
MMKKQRGYIIGMLAVFLAAGYACQDLQVDSANSVEEQAFQSQQMGNSGSMQAVHMQRNFRTHLKGENEVPAADTDAQGQATFQVSRDGESINYKLIVANIENVRMAHIHLAPAGENGGVVVWLYPDAPPPQLIEGRFQGILAEGIFTADDFVGQLEGATLEDLIEVIKAGNAYVNVHTDQFPGGEIRGQIH